MFQRLNSFTQQHPALGLGIALYLGVCAAVYSTWLALLPLFILLLARQRLLYILLFAAGYLYLHANYTFPKVPEEGINGTAHFSITSFHAKSTHYGKQWIYRGQLRSFTPYSSDTSIAKNIPISISVPEKEEWPPPQPDSDYRIQATLKQNEKGAFYLKLNKELPWFPIHFSYSFAHLRFLAKKTITNEIEAHYPSKRSAHFLSGIATGEFDDPLLAMEFSRFGLQHIMAISGFHFAIIASILSLFFKFLFPKRVATLFLITALSSYFVFLGASASVMRAWIAIVITFAGFLLDRQGSGLNALGVALIAVMLFDPLCCTSIGFQFSFLVTAFILLTFETIDAYFQRFFYIRTLGTVTRMDSLNQHGYYLSSMTRQSLALGAAVNIAALPLTLLYFHSFPLLSLIYNLFFPFLVSFSMLLLLLGLLIPWAGAFFHSMNAFYTHFLLNFTHQMPKKLDVTFRNDWLTLEMLILYLCGVTCLFLYLNKDAKQNYNY